MGFGLFYLPCLSSGVTAADRYNAILAEVHAAEELGWDGVWLAEHHFDPYGGIVPSTIVLATAIAMRTRRIHVGPAVLVVPLQDAMHMAEELAMLDVLSGGRLEVGVGRGFVPHEFASLNISLEARQERFEEGLEILLKAWSGERFSYQGRFHHLTNVQLYPSPLQRPRPRIWLAAALNQASYELAGQQGFNLMINPYTRTVEEVARGLSWYREAYTRAGHNPAQMRVLAHFHLYVAPTEERAREEPREALLQYLEQADRANSPGSGGSPQHTAPVSYEGMYPERVMFGVPELIERKLRRWTEAGVTDFCFMTQFGNLAPEQSLASLRLFSAEIMPRFAKAA